MARYSTENYSCAVEYIDESILAARVRFQHEQSGSDCDTSRGATSFRHGRHFRSVREGLPATRQEEEIRDESAQENAQSSFQRDFHIQGQSGFLLVF